MLNEIKQAVIDQMTEIYPASGGYTIYDDDIPENFLTPSFLVEIIAQTRSRRISKRYQSKLLFDVSYYSDKSSGELKNDCYAVQERLLRSLDLIGTYRAQNLEARITDNVLHVTFDISYSEMIPEESNPMQQVQANTNIE